MACAACEVGDLDILPTSPYDVLVVPTAVLARSHPYYRTRLGTRPERPTRQCQWVPAQALLHRRFVGSRCRGYLQRRVVGHETGRSLRERVLFRRIDHEDIQQRRQRRVRLQRSVRLSPALPSPVRSILSKADACYGWVLAGNAVAVFGDVGRKHAKFSVEMDGQAVGGGTAFSASGFQTFVPLWREAGLQRGEHRLRITHDDISGLWLSVDKFLCVPVSALRVRRKNMLTPLVCLQILEQ